MIKQLEYESLPEDFFEVDIISNNSVAERRVSEIIADVRERGDAALLEYTERFDGARLDDIAVSREEMRAARENVPKELLSVMEEAAENIREFHRRQISGGFRIERPDGCVLGQLVGPIERVGVYIPGGTASYPSTVLMNLIPARLAGVEHLAMTTPPGRDGKIPDAILAAAEIAGVDIIYKCGGAQAIAALAYGTKSVKRVYKITGPGNIYVALAKRQVFGAVDIDMIAGPSDVLIIADDGAQPELIAMDMLAQAEHDPLARALLVTTSTEIAEAVGDRLCAMLKSLPRKDIAGASIENNGAIIIVPDLAQAMECANKIAPEHLQLCVREPWPLLEKVKNAGSVFLGQNTPEALGDYFAGPNHTLPTMGTARFRSPLSVDDFVRRSGYTYYTEAAMRAAAPKIAAFARAEGLEAHALSAELRG